MRIHVVDAFTDRPFAGNPAGVCLPDAAHAGDETWMRALAAELGFAETAYVTPTDAPEADYELRWFTPEIEIDLCGHATLATAHTLFGMGHAGERIRFATRSGVLVADLVSDGIALDFPALPAREVPEPAGLAAALGAQPLTVFAAGAQLFAVLASPDAVRRLTPDLAFIAGLQPYHGVVVTAEGGPHGADFVSRFFAPAVGVPEDPVTGSAHCALAPYWGGRLGRTRMTGHQLSARGGRVGVELYGGDRVRLLGTAVTVLEGELRA